MPALTWSRIAAWRVRRQSLDRRAPAGSMLELASRLCGLHAQVMSSAEFTLWARMHGIERDTVRRALWDERTLVKTWAMRGTLHLLPARELHLWHAALSINRRYLRASRWQRLFGISLEELDQITVAIGSALEGRELTREELVKEVARITRSKALRNELAMNSWGVLFRPAAFTGRLCFAPSLGQRVRFTHPQSWLTELASPVEPETAVLAIARRYLSVYGPATVDDLARWWGEGSLTPARRWIAALGDEVMQVELEDGDKAWMLTKHARELRTIAPGRTVNLLPAFDQYVVAASRHARNLLPGDLRARVYRPQGWLSPVLLVNGRMDGVWRHELKGSRIAVTIDPFVKPPIWARRKAEEEAERLAAFLGGELTLSWES